MCPVQCVTYVSGRSLIKKRSLIQDTWAVAYIVHGYGEVLSVVTFWYNTYVYTGKFRIFYQTVVIAQ